MALVYVSGHRAVVWPVGKLRVLLVLELVGWGDGVSGKLSLGGRWIGRGDWRWSTACWAVTCLIALAL
jgi:hypothetical protein